MANKFFWYELMTSDARAAGRFYANVVGWKLTDFPAGGHPYTVLELADGVGTGGIMPIPPEAAAGGMKPNWVGYIHVTDLDAGVKALEAAGGTLHHILPPIPQVGKIAIAADPQGAMINLLQPDGPDAAPPARGTNGTVDWHELHSSDAAAGCDFYAKAFGWSKSGSMEMGPMGTYQFFAMEPVEGDALCESTAGGMMTDAQSPRSYWLFYVHVDDIDAAAQRVKDNGGTILRGPDEVPGGAWVLNCQDPQGAIFALSGPRK